MSRHQSFLHVVRLIFALLMGCFALHGCGPIAHVGIGQRCWVDYECNDGLTCAANACHLPCSADSACGDAGACLAIAGKQVCGQQGDCESQNDCAAGQQCSSNRCVGGSSQKDGAAGSPADANGEARDEANPGDGSGSVDAPTEASSEGGTSCPSADAETTSMLDFRPSNFSSVGLPWEKAPIVKITRPDCDETCLPQPITEFTTDDGAAADLYLMESFSLDATAALALRGSRPVIMAVAGSVEIGGRLTVAASGAIGGPGGYSSGVWPGPGAGEASNAHSGGGGGTYCLANGTAGGGPGGASSGTAAGAGRVYGRPDLVPLIGGSAGGDGSEQVAGGGGGGAIQIVAGSEIVVSLFGRIHAGGGGGMGAVSASGGGSGGAILLEAPMIVINGHVAANGGGGGQGGARGAPGNSASDDDQPAPGGGGNGDDVDGTGGRGSAGNLAATGGLPLLAGASGGGGGGGGPGRIRINTRNGHATISGVVSPSLQSLCASQGAIAPSACRSST